jgi:hypothetical protein
VDERCTEEHACDHLDHWSFANGLLKKRSCRFAAGASGVTARSGVSADRVEPRRRDPNQPVPSVEVDAGTEAGTEECAALADKGQGEPLFVTAFRGYPSVSALCEAFVQRAKLEGEEIAASFSFRQLAASCVEVGPVKNFKAVGRFTDARVLRTTRISRKAERLALKVDQSWYETSVAWNEQESESATPRWGASEPESFEVSGNRWIAYLGGDDVGHNMEVTNDNKLKNSTLRMLRGAFVCEVSNSGFGCVEWNPADRVPLGVRVGARAATAWKRHSWESKHEVTLDLVAAFPACAGSYKP